MWHSKKTEAQAQVVYDTWYNSTTTFFLAAEGSRSSALPLLNVPTVKADDYLSTLGKGLLGLVEMYKRQPRGKWYVVVGDDVYVNGAHMSSLLSAFNPANAWCVTHAGQTIKHGFRMYGGAGIATSNGLTQALAKVLPAQYREQMRPPRGASGADTSKLHDLAFGAIMRRLNRKAESESASATDTEEGGVAPLKHLKITHADGFFSATPGFYLADKGRKDVPRGFSSAPASLHYVKGTYELRFLRFGRIGGCVAPRRHPSPTSPLPAASTCTQATTCGTSTSSRRGCASGTRRRPNRPAVA